MKKLVFDIVIQAGKEKVWQTMLEPGTYNQWSGAGWAGSYYEGEWKQGTEIRFYGPDKSGTLVHLDEVTPFEYIGATHTAVLLKGGVIDKESTDAKGWVGTKENYTFSQAGVDTHLKVHIIMVNPAWESMFSDGWPKALKKLKELCEQ